MRNIFLTACGLAAAACGSDAVRVTPLTGFPCDEEGLAKGVSACYAGILDDCLIMAGGCNFPGLPPRMGGAKKYYDGIYAARRGEQTLVWERIGTLPLPAAYGVSVTTPEGIVCIGGNNAERQLDTVFCIKVAGGTARIEPMPSLPAGIDNFTGAFAGRRIYVAGGVYSGKADRKAFFLDLDALEKGWQALPDFPGPRRTQPVSALFEKDGRYTFYLWGGFAGATDGDPVTLSVDGLKYDSATDSWSPVSGPVDREGTAVSLGGGAAAVLGSGKVVATGGVDKDIFYNALVKLPEGYFEHEPEWFRLGRNILVYDTASDKWSVAGVSSETARAGAVLVGDGRTFANICGELMPGVRSPQVTLLEF
ncbi:MAG: cyclically-permuted mutarotase family protein [Bacteroidales bacterium]|nr:cyclically-permuted mutarotase family protein [Bacteroidales bacterium]